jgi:hypothetical protein
MKKPTTQEVEDLIKYCTDKERSVPKPYKWVEVMKIIEYEKIEKHYQKTLQCLILGAWNFASKESKIKVLRNQILWAGNHNLVDLNIVSTKRDKIFYELKDFLMNLPEEEWCHQEI